MDSLRNVLPYGSPERWQLDSETNYIDHDVTQPFPVPFESFDGILASHCLEHFDCMAGIEIMRECRRALRSGGVLLVSVPDASYFRQCYNEDTPDNAVRLFGEPIHLPDGEQTFFGYALWNRYHKAILTEDALWCYFKRAGFDIPAQVDPAILGPMTALLNRRAFSIEMMGVKP